MWTACPIVQKGQAGIQAFFEPWKSTVRYDVSSRFYHLLHYPLSRTQCLEDIADPPGMLRSIPCSWSCAYTAMVRLLATSNQYDFWNGKYHGRGIPNWPTEGIPGSVSVTCLWHLKSDINSKTILREYQYRQGSLTSTDANANVNTNTSTNTNDTASTDINYLC